MSKNNLGNSIVSVFCKVLAERLSAAYANDEGVELIPTNKIPAKYATKNGEPSGERAIFAVIMNDKAKEIIDQYEKEFGNAEASPRRKPVPRGQILSS